MSDPFRSELEAAHQRIEKLEADHKARVAELERENDRLRKRLLDAAPPSRSKTGKTFFAIGMMTLGVSLVVGMVFARVATPPPAPMPIQLVPAQTVEELPADHTPMPNDFSLELAGKVLSLIHIDDCATPGSDIVGHAKITFAPTGMVSSVVIAPPYAGTSIGDCVQKRYERASVPKFDGAPRVVGKTFSIK